MATIKIKFRASSLKEREGALFYQVIHRRSARQISTGYRIYPDEWDSVRSEVMLPRSGTGEERREHLLSVRRRVESDLFRLRSIIRQLECGNGDYTSEKIAELYRSTEEEAGSGFISFADKLIGQLKAMGRMHTVETYTCTLSSFRKFMDGKDIPLEMMNAILMAQYEAWLKSRGLCQNSSSYYMRNLRAIYNKAVEKELTLQRRPFRYVYTGIDKTVKRALPLTIIRRINSIDLSYDMRMEFARDIFMFSFYTRGMSFIDMAFLKKSDLRNGILSYRRQKTGQLLMIRWEPQMQEIVDKYDTSGSTYLLPIIREKDSNEQKQYRSSAHFINNKLKMLGEILGLPIPLTSYVARHSWASIAKSKNIPISTISEAMGHDSENTTRIYLASLDTSAIDKANRLILKSL